MVTQFQVFQITQAKKGETDFQLDLIELHGELTASNTYC
jgi:hypothetical protein